MEYKVLGIADSSNGYTVDFNIYIGKSAEEPVSENRLGYDVVVNLMDRFLNQGYHLYTRPFEIFVSKQSSYYRYHQRKANSFLKQRGTVWCVKSRLGESTRCIPFAVHHSVRGNTCM